MSGHYAPKKKDNNEVWGLASLHNRNWFVTCSDDGTLRIWDATNDTQLAWIDLTKDKNNKALPVDPKTKDLAHEV